MKLYLVCIKGFLEIRSRRRKTTIYKFDSSEVEQYARMKERGRKFDYYDGYCINECFDYLMRIKELIYMDTFANFKLSEKALKHYIGDRKIESWFGKMSLYHYIKNYGGIEDFLPEVAKVY
jgi:hypothetical protein